MSLFDENLMVIDQKKIITFIAEWQDQEVPFYYVGTDHDGTRVFCDNENRPLIIEPSLDETHLPNPKLKQLIFFFGIASLEEVQKVARSAHEESIFILIEPNPCFLQYALNHEHFEVLNDINYIIVADEPTNLDGLFKLLFSTKFFYLTKNMLFYVNAYYRKYDGRSVQEYIKEIGTALQNKYFVIGNSIHDSLLGLINNMTNIKAISENVDVAKLKGAFSGIPAFVVAAGPSLDKNIAELKKVQGKGLIIAVDTIAQKLIKHGIVPDFIASVERGAIVWEYFYKKNNYPKNMYLVSSLVVDPRIVKQFKNQAILPLRARVREYFWLKEKLGLTDEHYMTMGASCAHIAMGLALHVGASPIVMVGQDLAYGDKGTHASGTVYDGREESEEDKDDSWIPGYYGGQVRTQKIWLEFKVIFETMIKKHYDKNIINATEGGAKIEGARQETLADVIERYCKQPCNVYQRLQAIPFTELEWPAIEERITAYLVDLEQYRTNVAAHLEKLREYNKTWKSSMADKKIAKIYSVMQETNEYYRDISKNQLLFHNLQGPLLVLMQKFQTIPENDSLDSLKQNLSVQIELCEMIENTAWLIIQVIEENFPWSGDNKPNF